VQVELPFPAAFPGIVGELPLEAEALAQTRSVLRGGDELGAGQAQLAFARLLRTRTTELPLHLFRLVLGSLIAPVVRRGIGESEHVAGDPYISTSRAIRHAHTFTASQFQAFLTREVQVHISHELRRTRCLPMNPGPHGPWPVRLPTGSAVTDARSQAVETAMRLFRSQLRIVLSSLLARIGKR
jgi:hypothetical protein